MKMKNKRYYKITTEIAGEQVSYFVYGTPAEVKYPVGEWAEAPKWLAKKKYGLFVFDGLKNAREFSKLCASPCLWRCEVDGIFDRLPLSLSMHGLNAGKVIKLYPKGTVMVKRVKLIRQVKSGAWK